MKVVVVGAGPVGCLLAVGLAERGAEVTVYERSSAARLRAVSTRPSFNLTLTRRGLRHVGEAAKARLYEHGVPLTARLVHLPDGSVEREQYGSGPDDHLLSVPRRLLHDVLLTAAAEVDIRFGHDCVRVDPSAGTVVAVHDRAVVEDGADLVVGCDGAGSAVRHALMRAGADVHQDVLAEGFVEHRMPGPVGEPLARGGAAEAALHLWPRGDRTLIAQPNRDGSRTVTLFMPLVDPPRGGPGLLDIRTAEQVHALFARDFAEVRPALTTLVEDFLAHPPSRLRTVTCAPFHHGRAVLVGDAARTVVPFYGQGINSGFEDVGVLLDLLDGTEPQTAAARFSELRGAPSATIAELSRAHLRALVSTDRSSARTGLERRLQERCPERFATLYALIAFSHLPYDEARELHRRRAALLDRLCEDADPAEEQERIIEQYRAAAGVDLVLDEGPLGTCAGMSA